MDEIRHHATFGHAYTGSVRSGMELPNAHLAIVEQAKIIDYLLNSDHPDNAGKARFFLDLGFNPQNWQSLADAFRDHAVNAITIRV